MAEYDANEQGDLQELEGGIEQNLSDSASAAKNIYNAQRKFRTNHKNDAEEVSDDYDTSHQNNKPDKTSNANSPPQYKPPNGKSHSKANQKKSLRDKKSAESSAAKKSSSKLAQKKSKKAAEKSEETAKKGLRKLWSIISGIFGAMSVPTICILLVVVIIICIIFGGVSAASTSSGSEGGGGSGSQTGSGTYIEMLKGEVNNGGQKYCDVMYGGELVDWCAIFVGWSIKQVGKDPADYGYSPGVGEFQRSAAAKNTYHENDGHYTPRPGDFLICRSSDCPRNSHIGVVIAVNGDEFTTIEGNT